MEELDEIMQQIIMATGNNDGQASAPDNALRPVVCLKNTVKLELSSDNTTYNIVND